MAFPVLGAAPEHFGDTILFTTDDDILEAIFCSDATFDLDVESLCPLQPDEALQRPSTADGEGDERPFTQAGLWADGWVGLGLGATGRAPHMDFLLPTRRAAGRIKMDVLEVAAAPALTSPIFLLHFLPCVSYFTCLVFSNRSEESIQILIKAERNHLCVICVI